MKKTAPLGENLINPRIARATGPDYGRQIKAPARIMRWRAHDREALSSGRAARAETAERRPWGPIKKGSSETAG